MKQLPSERQVFYAILTLAAIVRFWNYGGWSYSHDEIGAFIRLNFSGFGEFIREGVQNTDTHPALTQIFLWLWSSLFGLSEWSMRLPFVLAGVGSVALVYKIAYRWFGRTPAELSSLTIALLVFPVLYSQLARPYSFGLFFSLLAVWRWQILLFEPGKQNWQQAAWYGLATLGCMLTHYFSFFFAMIVAASGFFFLNRMNWKYYLGSGLMAALLFLPHIPVSLHQFSMGGIGTWLAAPGNDFLWQHILYICNESPFVLILLTALSLTGLVLNFSGFRFYPAQALCLLWFLAPAFAGYYYSVSVNPVMQHSTLLFSFPFLILFLFSFFRQGSPKLILSFEVLLTAVLLYSTVIDQKFYSREYFSPFREINEFVSEKQSELGSDVTVALNTSSREIFDFYFDRMGEAPNYAFVAGDEPEALKKYRDLVDQCTTEYFLYGWSNFRSDYEIPEMIKKKFPCIVHHEAHFNAEWTLFARNDSCRRDTLFYEALDFDTPNTRFEYAGGKVDSAANRCLPVDPEQEYCITLKSNVEAVSGGRSRAPADAPVYIHLSARILVTDSFNVQAVLDIGQPDSKVREWQARPLRQFGNPKDKWVQIFATFRIPASCYPDDEVKIYLWNNGKNSFRLDDVAVSCFRDSRYDPFRISYRD